MGGTTTRDGGRGSPADRPRRGRALPAGAPATLSVALVLLALAAAVLPARAAAWANGGHRGNGFGTHDWVLLEAHRLARAAGCSWLDLKAALPRTDDPDMRLHDTYHHVYDVWGSRYGDAPRHIQKLYDKAVRQLRAGKRRAASVTFALLSHYYSDICNPLHTDQRRLEERIHASYEAAVQTRTDKRGEHRGWVRAGRVTVRSSAAAAARGAATWAHRSYKTLVNEYARRGYSPRVNTITRRCLSRAANDLADLLLSIKRDR